MPEDNEFSLSIDKTQFDELVREIRTLARAMVASQINHERGTEKNARFLKVFGFTDQEIGDLLGVTQPAVTMALSKSKRTKK
jgi:predicted transcriptional regulator